MNKNEILASIIVPFHNEETHLSDAVASVLEQDHPLVELILVDDRSTDGSLELAQSLASEHPNIVLASSTRKPGPAGTRNSGLQLATGRVITYLDGDDLMVPGRVSSFIAYLIEHWGYMDICMNHSITRFMARR
jgi:teichuronic acid biosynthesis glycosyltransferase TuaG